MAKQEPILSLGPFTGRIYIVTRYRLLDSGIMESLTKYDVTDQFMNIYAEATAKFDYTPRPPVQETPPATYDREAHSWNPRCPHGDDCSGCDALGYCTREEADRRAAGEGTGREARG